MEVLYEKFGLAPQAPSQASRVAVPVYRGKQQVGKRDFHDVVADIEEDDCARFHRIGARAKPGTQVEMELTIEAVRHGGREDRGTPFYNPPHKTATPV